MLLCLPNLSVFDSYNSSDLEPGGRVDHNCNQWNAVEFICIENVKRDRISAGIIEYNVGQTSKQSTSQGKKNGMEEEFLKYKLGPYIQLKLKVASIKALPLSTCVNLLGKF